MMASPISKDLGDFLVQDDLPAAAPTFYNPRISRAITK